MTPPATSGSPVSLSPFERTTARFWEMWQADLLNTPLRCAAFALALLAIPVIFFLCASFPQYKYAHDSFIFLDGAWRVLDGQRPQVDFSTNLGALVFLLTAAGFQLTHHGGHALAFCQAAYAAAIALLAVVLVSRRLPRLAGIFLAALIVLMAVASFNTGEEPLALTYAMFYNRVGYALLAVLLIEVTQAPRGDDALGGALAGFILVVLFFTKFTYAILGVSMVLALLHYRRQTAARWLGMAAGAGLPLLAMLAYLRFDVAAILLQIRMSSIKQVVVPELIRKTLNHLPLGFTLLALAALASYLVASAAGRRRLVISRMWAVAVIFAVDLALLGSNFQQDGTPLIAIACVLIAADLAFASRFSVPMCVLVTAGLLAPAAAQLLPYGGGFLFTVFKASGIHTNASELRFADAPLSDMSVRGNATLTSATQAVVEVPYVAFVDDGSALLRAHSSANESIVSLENSNPFSIALARQPPRGGTTCLSYGTTFNDTHKLTPAQLLGDAKLVMWPKLFTDGSLPPVIDRIYGDGVRASFRKVAESRYWTLYRRVAGL